MGCSGGSCQPVRIRQTRGGINSVSMQPKPHAHRCNAGRQSHCATLRPHLHCPHGTGTLQASRSGGMASTLCVRQLLSSEEHHACCWCPIKGWACASSGCRMSRAKTASKHRQAIPRRSIDRQRSTSKSKSPRNMHRHRGMRSRP